MSPQEVLQRAGLSIPAKSILHYSGSRDLECVTLGKSLNLSLNDPHEKEKKERRKKEKNDLATSSMESKMNGGRFSNQLSSYFSHSLALCVRFLIFTSPFNSR